jgi:hypothetical protein
MIVAKQKADWKLNIQLLSTGRVVEIEHRINALP